MELMVWNGIRVVSITKCCNMNKSIYIPERNIVKIRYQRNRRLEIQYFVLSLTPTLFLQVLNANYSNFLYDLLYNQLDGDLVSRPTFGDLAEFT